MLPLSHPEVTATKRLDPLPLPAFVRMLVEDCHLVAPRVLPCKRGTTLSPAVVPWPDPTTVTSIEPDATTFVPTVELVRCMSNVKLIVTLPRSCIVVDAVTDLERPVPNALLHANALLDVHDVVMTELEPSLNRPLNQDEPTPSPITVTL